MNELYLRYRPEDYDDVVGQDEVVESLRSFEERNEMPHVILLSGPSGTGKTTLARIIRKRLGCADVDFVEVNAAQTRGIDMVRDIQRQCGSSPMGGKCRGWLIDECQQITKDAAGGFLKILEDTPKHVYFILATTDPHKLIKTLRTRCTEFKLKPVSESDLVKLMVNVLKQEKVTVEKHIIEKIAENADGSVRQALVLLNTIYKLKDFDQQLALVCSEDATTQAIEICRALIKGTTWPNMQKILSSVSEEPETIRRIVLGYCKSTMLKSKDMKTNQKAALIIEEFRDNWFDCGEAGLVISCWNVVNYRK